jgi:23S rRNA pseudouridine1911/1915/1917 synthase
VLFAKRPAVAREYQMAIQERRVRKAYLAILEGELGEPVTVDQPIARRKSGGGAVRVKNEVSCAPEARHASTTFTPLAAGGGHTLARVEPHTGRQHQIRVHAEWLKHRVVGDKVYGPDEALFLEFIDSGWTERLAAAVPLRRHALHSYQWLLHSRNASLFRHSSGSRSVQRLLQHRSRYVFQFPDRVETFTAPFPADLRAFCTEVMGLAPEDGQRLVATEWADAIL